MTIRSFLLLLSALVAISCQSAPKQHLHRIDHSTVLIKLPKKKTEVAKFAIYTKQAAWLRKSESIQERLKSAANWTYGEGWLALLDTQQWHLYTQTYAKARTIPCSQKSLNICQAQAVRYHSKSDTWYFLVLKEEKILSVSFSEKNGYNYTKAKKAALSAVLTAKERLNLKWQVDAVGRVWLAWNQNPNLIIAACDPNTFKDCVAKTLTGSHDMASQAKGLSVQKALNPKHGQRAPKVWLRTESGLAQLSIARRQIKVTQLGQTSKQSSILTRAGITAEEKTNLGGLTGMAALGNTLWAWKEPTLFKITGKQLYRWRPPGYAALEKHRISKCTAGDKGILCTLYPLRDGPHQATKLVFFDSKSHGWQNIKLDIMPGENVELAYIKGYHLILQVGQHNYKLGRFSPGKKYQTIHP